MYPANGTVCGVQRTWPYQPPYQMQMHHYSEQVIPDPRVSNPIAIYWLEKKSLPNRSRFNKYRHGVTVLPLHLNWIFIWDYCNYARLQYRTALGAYQVREILYVLSTYTVFAIAL